MIPQSSAFEGGFYGGDIENQRMKLGGYLGSSTSSSFPSSASNAPFSSRVGIGMGLGLGPKFTLDQDQHARYTEAMKGQHGHGQNGQKQNYGGSVKSKSGSRLKNSIPEPTYIPINQLMVRDILTFIRNNGIVNACVSVIPQRLLNKDFVWLGRLGNVNEAVKKALNINWKIVARAAFRSAIDIGVIMVKTRPHDILSEIPVILSYAIHTPEFYITKDDEFKWRVKDANGDVVEDADVIEVYRPYTTGHLASPMAMLLAEIYQHRFLQETFAYSIYNRARPPIILEQEQPRAIAGMNGRSGNSDANINTMGKTLATGVLGQRNVQSMGSNGSVLDSVFRITQAVNSMSNVPTSQEGGASKLRDLINAPYRSHTVEMDDDMKRTVFKTMNDYRWVQPTFSQSPEYLPQLLENFEKMCARVMHVPREVWADQYTRFKTSETLASGTLQDCLEFWAGVIEDLFNPLVYRIYGMQEMFFALLFDEEAEQNKPKFSKQKEARLREERAQQIELFFESYAPEDPDNDQDEEESNTPPPLPKEHPGVKHVYSANVDKNKVKKRKRSKSSTDSSKSSNPSKRAKTTRHEQKQKQPPTRGSKTKSSSESESESGSDVLSERELTLGVRLGWRVHIQEQEEMKQRLSMMDALSSKKEANSQLIQVISSLQMQFK